MNSNKRIKKMVYALFMLFALMITTNVYADTPHNLNLKMVKCDSNKYNNLLTYDDYNNCYTDYINGDLSTYVINNNDEVDAGSTIMFILNYVPGSPQVITSINSRLLIDTAIWTPAEDEGEFLFFETNNWPRKSNYTTDWNYNSATGVIGGSFVDSKNKPLTSETELVYFFLKLNDSATGSASVNFSKEGGRQDVTDFDGTQYEVNTTDISVNIPGEEISHDATLGTLTVTNSSTTYQSSPSFVAGSSQKTYDYIVPNNISFINLSATANHSQASVLSGGIGKKNLNVGSNTFNLTVTAAYGNTETYTINVYRLSNDATLSAINLTNSISFGNMISGTYAYQVTIPYAINSTSVSATTNHKNAYVDSGLGNWNLPNSGNLSNNKTLVVKAENCLSKYASVPGNTCTTQNYNLTINREAASNNSYLKTLTVDGNLVNNFNKTIQEYDLGQVANNKTSLLLNGLVDDTGKLLLVDLERLI